MKNSRKFVSAGLMYLVLIIIFIVAMFPVLYTILGSFKGNMELLASNGKLLPEKFVFDNYKQAWELGNFAKYTGNSIFMAGTIVFGTIFTSTVAGYSTIETTLPDPTVLPPSRIAKRRPCSIATG